MSPPSTIGIAFLGAGLFPVQAHLPALLRLFDPKTRSPNNLSISIKAVYSKSTARCDEFVKKIGEHELGKNLTGVDVYSDEQEGKGGKGLDELLKRDDIQAVIVALPITIQPAVLIKAFEAGKHVLAEKPIAPTVKEAKALVSQWESKFRSRGLLFVIAEQKTFTPALLYAASLVPKLGSSYHFSIINHAFVDPDGSQYYKTPWRKVPNYQGGFLLDGGVHQTAILRILWPTRKVEKVTAFTDLRQEYLPPKDSITAILKFEELPNTARLTGNFTISFGCESKPPQPGRWFEVYGSDGALEIVKSPIIGGTQVNLRLKEGKGESVSKTFIEETDEGVEKELELFVEAVEETLTSGKGPKWEEAMRLGDPDGARRDLEIIEGCLRSGEKDGALVNLSEL